MRTVPLNWYWQTSTVNFWQKSDFSMINRTSMRINAEVMQIYCGVDKTQKPVYITQAFRFYLIRQS